VHLPGSAKCENDINTLARYLQDYVVAHLPKQLLGHLPRQVTDWLETVQRQAAGAGSVTGVPEATSHLSLMSCSDHQPSERQPSEPESTISSCGAHVEFDAGVVRR
jgi:hypothetical protein